VPVAPEGRGIDPELLWIAAVGSSACGTLLVLLAADGTEARRVGGALGA